ncbi:transposon Ty3-I Gag-Pol polyprotein [Trichonephila clavipes]|nr:transposon Ty3-I Gag-Pol polyprotein [Trichonephila clavipes]
MAASGANESDSENEMNDSSMQADSMGKNLDLEINKMHVDNGSQNKDVVNKNKIRYDNNNTGYESYKKKVCFNCGDPINISRNCMYKNEGIKCFRCEGSGHKASECPDNNDTKLDVAHLIMYKEETSTKEVLIGDLILDALIDSGSQVTLIRKSVYDKINHVQLFPLNTTFKRI